jgi:hypothetical protein
MKDRVLKTLDVVVWTLLTIGGLNWGALGLFNVNVISGTFGPLNPVTRTIYILVGLAAMYEVVGVRAISHRWDLHYGRRPVAV